MSNRQSLISKVFGSRGLKGISEIRTFFRTNEQPIFFVGPTAFNLLGIDRWVRGFEYIVYYDCWDSAHPRVFTPSSKPYVEFESSEQINNYLLRDPEVQKFIDSRCAASEVRPMIAMVFFDEETEQICADLDYTLILPPDSLRRRLDSKIVTTRLGDEAGAPSVPNVLGHADSYEELTALAIKAGLGSDLVVQTPYGDSGKTTFFITSEAEWDRDSANIIGHDRPHRLPRTHALPRRLVRERPFPGSTFGVASQHRDRARTAAR